MGDLRRLNHWVPAAYLAAFTDDGSKDSLFYACRRDSDRILELPPSAVAKERDRYVVERADGVKDDSVERFLAEHVEMPFLNVRNILAYGRQVGLTGVLTDEQENSLALWLAFQQLRTPRFQQSIDLLLAFQGNFVARAGFSDLERARRDLEEAHRGRSFTIEEVGEIREALEQGNVVVEPTEKAWLAFALELAIDLRPIFRSLPRRVIDLPQEANLPTSDEPIVLVRRVSRDEYVHGGGIANENVEIVLPLTPRCVLVLGRALDSFADQGDPNWLTQVRHRIVTAAGQWVFSQHVDNTLPDLLRGKPPTTVIEFSGGMLRPGQSAYEAVKRMMEANPGEAIIRFGPEAR